MGKPSSKQLDDTLLDTAGHAATDHSALPGVLSSAAHATTDHSAIPGAGGGGVALGNGTTGGTSGSVSVPAGTITQAGEWLRFVAGWTNNSSNTSGSLTFGGTTIKNMSIGNSSAAFESWVVEIMYLGSNNWYYNVAGYGDQADNDNAVGTLSSVDPSGALTFNYTVVPAAGETWDVASGFANVAA